MARSKQTIFAVALAGVALVLTVVNLQGAFATTVSVDVSDTSALEHSVTPGQTVTFTNKTSCTFSPASPPENCRNKDDQDSTLSVILGSANYTVSGSDIEYKTESDLTADAVAHYHCTEGRTYVLTFKAKTDGSTTSSSSRNHSGAFGIGGVAFAVVATVIAYIAM